MTPLLVLTGLEVEARTLARHLGLPRIHGAAWPRYGDGALEVASVGLGASLLDTRGAAWPRPPLVVAAGTCGALAPTLGIGELVVPETVTAAGNARLVTDAVAGLARSGVLLSVERPVETVADKARLWLETGALAVDMESAAIIAWARARGARVSVVRGVSDRADAAVPADLAALVEPGGRLRAGAAVRAALARPRALADALALGRGAAAALRAVAAAVSRVARG